MGVGRESESVQGFCLRDFGRPCCPRRRFDGWQTKQRFSQSRRSVAVASDRLGNRRWHSDHRRSRGDWPDGSWRFDHHDRTGGNDLDRKSTRLNSSHTVISYAVFCLKKKKCLSSQKKTEIKSV